MQHDQNRFRLAYPPSTGIGLAPTNILWEFKPRNNMVDEGPQGGEPTISQEHWTRTSSPLQQSDEQLGLPLIHSCSCAQCTFMTEAGYAKYFTYGPVGLDAQPPTVQQQFGPITSDQQVVSAIGFEDNRYHPYEGMTTRDVYAQSVHGAQTHAFGAFSHMESQSVNPAEVVFNRSPAPSLSDSSSNSNSIDMPREIFSVNHNNQGLPHSVRMKVFRDPWGRYGPWGNLEEGMSSRSSELYTAKSELRHAGGIRDNCESTCSNSDVQMSSYAESGFYGSTNASGQVSSIDTSEPLLSTTSHRPRSGRPFQRSKGKDQMLVDLKLAGLSYKDIKAKGGFKEAESTLRGRFRSLTKEKQQRVRKPTWKRRDIKLLREGVRKLSTQVLAYDIYSVANKKRSKSRRRPRTKLRTPWKDVAGYIAANGGSYHFGNATCKKKWDDLGDQRTASEAFDEYSGEDDTTDDDDAEEEEEEEDKEV